MITKTECEQQILEKIEEIRAIYEQYHPNPDYLTINIYKDTAMGNNEYWSNDTEYPINFWRDYEL